MKKMYVLSAFMLSLSGCRIYTHIEGQGTVMSQSGKFNCSTGQSGTCEATYNTGGSETFEAQAKSGYTFAKWKNCDYVTLETCRTSWTQQLADDYDLLRITATFKEQNPPIQAATYTYNALGQRITKTVDGTTTIFQYDLQGNLIAEIDAATEQPLREHIHINNEPIAQLSIAPNGSVSEQYVHADHLGTPTLMTDAQGKVVADIESTPFGESYIDYAAIDHYRRFRGQYKDEETGLHYNYFRDYDPSLGRYIQSDPNGLSGGLNTYAYVGSNPLKYSDPYGLDILLQTHPVAFGFDHAKLTIVPNNQTAWANDPRFSNTLPDGRQYATLGAGPDGGDLVSNLNRSRDINLANNQTSSKCPTPNQYPTEDDLIRSLLDADQKYRDNLDYEYFPQSFTDGYNSNSYLNGLLRAVGINMPTPPSTPGFNKPLPGSSFR